MSEETMNEFGDGLPVGARIEEFEIVRELGRGGFGITYLARDHALARLVAVKEYLPQDWGTRQRDGTIGPRSSTSVADYAWGLERFVDEARVLARLNHPGIVSVYRILEAAGTAYMAMEYVEGHSLADELRLPGPLPERRVRKVLEGLAGGLAQVHAAGLLHRDIKPANVMLRAGDGSPVLIDFGAARQQMSRQSRSITAVLTPGYAPIEQYSARGRQGPWTDVYALGAVAYAALTGRVPDDATERTMGDALPPVESVAASPVSSALGGAVAAALAMNPTDRPQDMAEWLALLGESDGGGKSPAVPERDAGAEAWSGGEGTSAPPTPGERAVAAASGGPDRRPRRRVTPLAIGGAAAVLLGAVALAVLGRREDPATNWASEEEALRLGVEDRVLVQRGLLESGYDPGEWDGLLGAGTRAALREWQLARDLEPTGYLAAGTADVLRMVGEQAVADSVAEAERLAAAAADSIARADAEAQRLAAAAERRRPGRVFSDCSVCPEMVVVPAGTFAMGSPESEAGRQDNEGPRRYVTFAEPFAVGVHEVTFAEWDACARGGGCGGRIPDDEGWGRGDRPVINVSWDDAEAYTQWLSERTRREYRLPSEAEWEYVARAGTETARYWGESEAGQCRYGNGADAAYADAVGGGTVASCDDGNAYTAPVGSFGPNTWGLHDMLGNVWEWTADCWNDDYTGAPANGSARRSGDCSRRVLRGASWYFIPEYLRSAYRFGYQSGSRDYGIGFRVARTVN